jgi:transposase
MTSEDQPQYAAFVGLDWADKEHVVELISSDGQRQSFELSQTPEAIEQWARKISQQFGDGRLALCLEQSRGPLVAALLKYENFVLFPINPKQLASFRDAMYPSGSKDDPMDAELLMEIIQYHMNHLRPWLPDDALTRQIGRCCEGRRKLVEERKRMIQRLRQLLKEYYPLALDMFGDYLDSPLAFDFLMRWPTLKKVQRAKPAYLKKFFHAHNCRSNDKIEQRLQSIRRSQPLTTDQAIIEPATMMVQALIRQLRELHKSIATFDKEIATLFAKHEDKGLFTSLPGAGAVLAPRLLAAMGTQRDRYASAAEIQAYSGIGPVTKRSGRTTIVHRRYACPKFMRQTFHEFAEKSVLFSDWASAYYHLLRERGKKHNAAVRALAFKWIRIIFRMWKNREEYDESTYVKALKKRNSPIVKSLPTT